MEDFAQKTQGTYGCFFIIPLKFDPETLGRAQLERIGTLVSVRTMDLNENIKAMLTPSSGAAVGAGYRIPAADLAPWETFQVAGSEGTFPLRLGDSWIYVFHTRVAFLCLNLSFRQMDALRIMCNPGWARRDTVINLITMFGIVSILASVLSIVQILSDGGTLLWISTILTTIMLALVTLLAILRR